MCEIDKPHDAKDQCEARRNQKQQDTILQPIQALDQQKG